MKLAVISNLFPPHVVGGYELGCLSLSRAAQAAGHDVRVLTSACVGRLKKRESPTDLDVRYIFKPIYHYESAISNVPVTDNRAGFGGIETANVLALHSHIRDFEPDAIWIFNPLGLGPVGILETAVASGSPVSMHLMDHLDQTIVDNQSGFQMASRWARAKSKVGAIACSQKTLDRNQLVGDFFESIVIANGIPLGDREQSLHEHRDLSRDVLKLVYFGQVERHKGLLQLVDALGKLKNRLPNQAVQLNIIGTGSKVFRDELDAKISHLHLENSVVQHGFCNSSDLREKLSDMDLAVFPLNPNEPFAYVVIEAIDVGLPVIVTREAGCAEFLPNDYPYLLNDRDDSNELAEMLLDSVLNRHKMLSWIDRLKDCVHDQCDLHRKCLPRCVEFLSRRDINMAVAAKFDQSVDSLLASWHSNRHLELFAIQGPPRVPVGKQVERWVRRNLSSNVRRTFKVGFRRLVGKAA